MLELEPDAPQTCAAATFAPADFEHFGRARAAIGLGHSLKCPACQLSAADLFGRSHRGNLSMNQPLRKPVAPLWQRRHSAWPKHPHSRLRDATKVVAVFATAFAAWSMWSSFVPRAIPAMLRAREPVVVVHTAAGDLRLHVAANPQQRHAGLMNDTPKPGTGELFVWRDEGLRHFWMANTPSPLDMVFIDGDGIVSRVLAGVAPCAALPCPIYSHRARYVVELPAFTASTYGLRPGTQLRGFAGLR